MSRRVEMERYWLNMALENGSAVYQINESFVVDNHTKPRDDINIEYDHKTVMSIPGRDQTHHLVEWGGQWVPITQLGGHARERHQAGIRTAKFVIRTPGEPRTDFRHVKVHNPTSPRNSNFENYPIRGTLGQRYNDDDEVEVYVDYAHTWEKVLNNNEQRQGIIVPAAPNERVDVVILEIVPNTMLAQEVLAKNHFTSWKNGKKPTGLADFTIERFNFNQPTLDRIRDILNAAYRPNQNNENRIQDIEATLQLDFTIDN